MKIRIGVLGTADIARRKMIDMSEKARWYVVHTYSGYENKVKATIEKSVENRNLPCYNKVKGA